MSIREIISCIGDDLAVGTMAIDAGLSDYGRIQGCNTEDNIPGEGKIFYDIRFTAYRKEMKYLMKGIIVHIRSGRCFKESRNALISMLECLLAEIDVNKKKKIL